jgi:hypothetical protein
LSVMVQLKARTFFNGPSECLNFLSHERGAPLTVSPGLADLSRKTGLIVRAVRPGTIERLFEEIEKYDSHDRAETFAYLRRALHETRSSLSSEDVYLDK